MRRLSSGGIPLSNFAHGLAKMATGIGLEPRRADICKKIMRACILNSQMVAGTGKFCTLLIAASKGRIFAKSGAQGIYAVADMDSGISIISKTEDGNSEVNNAVVLEAIRQVGIADKELLKKIDKFYNIENINNHKTCVGHSESVFKLQKQG